MKKITLVTFELRTTPPLLRLWAAKGMRHQATFSRLYHDGDQWHSTDSFGRDDLLVLAKVADQTHSWICAQHQDTESAAKTTAPQNPNAKILPPG